MELVEMQQKNTNFSRVCSPKKHMFRCRLNFILRFYTYFVVWFVGKAPLSGKINSTFLDLSHMHVVQTTITSHLIENNERRERARELTPISPSLFVFQRMRKLKWKKKKKKIYCEKLKAKNMFENAKMM